MTLGSIQQHVTNPETCIQCSACEMACPQHAIQNIAGRFCVDFELCQGCAACIRECPTGAANAFVEVEIPYTLEEQASWMHIPSDLV